MRRDPDAEDGNVDHRDDSSGTPFQPAHKYLVIRDNSDSVDDNLHQQLNFKHPEEQAEKEGYNTGVNASAQHRFSAGDMVDPT